MSKISLKTQAKHTALGLLGVAAPAIILSTYHGLYAVTAAIGCVSLASIVGCVEGYGFGKHYYDDLIVTQSNMIDRLQKAGSEQAIIIQGYDTALKSQRAKITELLERVGDGV